MSNSACDLAIIGNGVLASTTALLVAERNPDLKISLIGPEKRVGVASLAAGAMLNLFGELDGDALACPFSRKKFLLGREAASRWQNHVAWLNEMVPPEFAVKIQPGTYILNSARANDLDESSFDAILSVATEFCEPCEIVTPRDIPGYRPSVPNRAIRALYLPQEGAVQSGTLIRALDWAIDRKSAITRVNSLATKVTPGETLTVVIENGESLECARVLIGNGASAQRLIEQIPELHRRVPRIFYGVGCSLVLRPGIREMKSVIRSTNRGFACGIHAVPDPISGDLYVGATNITSTYPRFHPRASALHNLLEGAMAQIHSKLYDAEIVETRIGWRPVSADLFPLIGPTSVEGLTILTGTRRDGLFFSPLYCAEIARALVEGGECFEGVFRPERKLIRPLRKEEAIEKSVQHLMSSGYDHGFRLPHTGWDERAEAMQRRFVEEIYRKAGDPSFGIPPELMYLYGQGEIQETTAEEIRL